MQGLTQPTLLLKPFAQSGDKNNIPVTNSDLANPQLADLTNGFPAITSEVPENGGLPPERKDFNGLGYLTTTYDYFYQAGGTFTFNSTISTAIGGYPKNARLWYTDGNGSTTVLRSNKENNTDNFVSTPSYIGTSWIQELPTLAWNNVWTGANTFTSSTYISGSNKQLFIKATNITRNTAPSSNINNVFVDGVDSAGKSLWGIYNRWYTTKQNEALLIAYKGTTTDNSWAGIGVGYDSSGNAYTLSTVQPSDTTTTSGTQLATTGWVNTVGNNCMHLSGNERADGIKTFTSVPIVEKASYTGFYAKRTDIEYNVTPASNITYGAFELQDKNGTGMVFFSGNKLANGTNGAGIGVRGADNTLSYIRIYRETNGNTYTDCPTPSSATDNSTKIATTAWVNNHLAATTVKSTLVGYTIPDYQSGVSVAFDSNNKYTVPGNGIVVIRCDGSYDYFGGSISGQDIKVGGDFSSYRSDQFCVIPVLSGNIMGKSETHGSPSLTFYPAFGG